MKIGIDFPVDIFGGQVTDMSPGDLPFGVSPACQDCEFPSGAVRTRDGLLSQFTPMAGNPTVNYLKTFINSQDEKFLLALDSLGNFYQEVPEGTLSIVRSGLGLNERGKSATLFGSEWLAYGDGLAGLDLPWRWDGTNFDRVSQSGVGGWATGASASDINSPLTAISRTSGIISGTITSPVGLTVGNLVTITGVTADTTLNGSYPVLTVSTSGLSFTAWSIFIPYAINSIVRKSNVVTASLASTGSITTGISVAISGVGDGSFDGLFTVTAISGTEISWAQTAADATSTGGTLYTASATATVVVTDVTASDTVFLVIVQLNADQPLPFQTGGNIVIAGNTNSYWNTTFAITGMQAGSYFGGTAPANTYWWTLFVNGTGTPGGGTGGTANAQLANSSPTVTGSAGPGGGSSAGQYQVACSFITRNDYITKPTPPISFASAGGAIFQITGIPLPIGLNNVVARLLMFTAANGDTFYYSTGTNGTPNMQINDIVTTSLQVNLTDSQLLASTDAQYLFSLQVLGEAAGVTAYSDRLFWTGVRNKVPNFLNMDFDGGFGPGSSFEGYAGLGASSGLFPWSNPTHAQGAPDGSYATVTISTSSRPVGSGPLTLTNYALATSGAVGNLAVEITGHVSSLRGTSLLIQPTYLGGPVGSPVTVYLGLSDSTILVPLPGTFTTSEVNDSSFGVTITAQVNRFPFGGTVSGTFSIDAAEIVVQAAPIPLGWSLDPVYGAGGSLGSTSYWGGAWEMSGNNSAPFGMITQSAYQDYLQVPIIQISTAYSVRFRALLIAGSTAGALNVELYSPSQGSLGIFSVPMANLSATLWTEFIGALIPKQAALPSDLVLRVYGTATSATTVSAIIDCIEVFPTLIPVLTSITLGSYADNPESYDAVDGDLIPNAGDGTSCSALFVLRGNLYICKETSLYSTSDDNTNEPAFWTINEVSRVVGTPGVNGAALGEDWCVIVSRQGAYMFKGGEPVKISQEIQPTTDYAQGWDSINWAAGRTIWVVVDTQKKRILFGLPFGNATQPSQIFDLDYSSCYSDGDIETLSPYHFSAYTGKLFAAGRSRRWSPWSIAANCGALVERPNEGTLALFLGNGAGNGKIYQITARQYTDDGAQIPSFYDFYFFLSDAEAQPVQLIGRKLISYLVFYVEGSGTLQLMAAPDNLVNMSALPSLPMSSPAARDLELPTNLLGERITFQIKNAGPASWFKMQKFTPSVSRDPWTPVRGVN